MTYNYLYAPIDASPEHHAYCAYQRVLFRHGMPRMPAWEALDPAHREAWREALSASLPTGYHIWNALPGPFRWTTHNLLAHPVSELLFLASRLTRGDKSRLYKLGNWLHDVTVPAHDSGNGRG